SECSCGSCLLSSIDRSSASFGADWLAIVMDGGAVQTRAESPEGATSGSGFRRSEPQLAMKTRIASGKNTKDKHLTESSVVAGGMGGLGLVSEWRDSRRPDELGEYPHPPKLPACFPPFPFSSTPFP